MNSVTSKILEILIGGVITVAVFGLLAMGIIGCLLLFLRLLKRPVSLHHFRAKLADVEPEKQELTKHEKYIWAQKIRQFGKANFKKILASKVISKSMILPTIGLIVLTVLFWLLALMMRFRNR